MGTLTYDSTTKVQFEDRTLAHVQIVIGSKLRRGESFYLNWVRPDHGRACVWIHPAVPLFYEFEDADQPQINQRWLEELVISANSAGGLWVSGEPGITVD